TVGRAESVKLPGSRTVIQADNPFTAGQSPDGDRAIDYAGRRGVEAHQHVARRDAENIGQAGFDRDVKNYIAPANAADERRHAVRQIDCEKIRGRAARIERGQGHAALRRNVEAEDAVRIDGGASRISK